MLTGLVDKQDDKRNTPGMASMSTILEVNKKKNSLGGRPMIVIDNELAPFNN